MKDIFLATILGLLFSLSLLMKWRFNKSLEILSMFGRPAASIFILSSVVILFYKDYHLSGLIAALLSIYLLRTIWTTWPISEEKRIFEDISKDQERWVSANSIDLQFANKSVKHEAPIMLLPPDPFPEMLIFPPTSQTLHELCG